MIYIVYAWQNFMVLVINFRGKGYQFQKYQLSILEISVMDFENIGGGTFSKHLGKF